MRKVKEKVFPAVIRTLRVMTPKPGEWLQEIPGNTFEIFVQKGAIVETAKIQCRMPSQNSQTVGFKLRVKACAS